VVVDEKTVDILWTCAGLLKSLGDPISSDAGAVFITLSPHGAHLDVGI
jgi:hypothetical protein